MIALLATAAAAFIVLMMVAGAMIQYGTSPRCPPLLSLLLFPLTALAVFAALAIPSYILATVAS